MQPQSSSKIHHKTDDHVAADNNWVAQTQSSSWRLRFRQRGEVGGGGVALETVIYPNFPLDLTGFFPGKHLIQFLANKMQNVRNSVLHNCILNMILNLMLNKFT